MYMVVVSAYYLLHGMVYSFDLMKIELGLLYAIAGVLIRLTGEKKHFNLFWLISALFVISGVVYSLQSDNWIKEYALYSIMIALVFVCYYYFSELLEYSPESKKENTKGDGSDRSND